MAHLCIVDSNRNGFDLLRTAKCLGHKVSFLSSQQRQLYSKDDKAFLAQIDQWHDIDDTSHLESVYACIHAIHQGSPIDAIICTLESAMRAAAYTAQQLHLPFTSLDAVNRCRDKNQMRLCLKQHNIPSAKFGYADTKDKVLELIKDIGVPVILKPRAGAASRMTYRLDSHAQFDRIWNDIQLQYQALPTALQKEFGKGILVESYLEGRIVSVEIARRNDDYHVFMISARQRSQEKETEEVGIVMSAPLTTVTKDKLINYVKQVIEALGLDFGLFHIEVMLTPQGPIIVEANLRLMGGSMPQLYERLTGHNIYESLIKLHCNDPIDAPDYAACGVMGSHRFQLAQDAVLHHLPQIEFAPELQAAIRSLNWAFPTSFPAKLNAGDILGRIQLNAPNHEVLAHRFEQVLQHVETTCPGVTFRRSRDALVAL